FASIVLCLSTGARASTIWHSTDGNVNTLNVTFQLTNTTNGISSFGIFAPTNTSLIATAGNYLPVAASADTVTFTASGANWVLSNQAHQTFTLYGSNQFLLGAQDSLGWHPDIGYAATAPNHQYRVYFNAGVTQPTDLLTTDVAPVPVPAAAWLFASGLLGMVAVARGRTRRA
ncbi:MAG TPA: hypothetical protein PLO69_13370, partial [Gammaproteobacteria bacterium]|nr:hypothetical protein [Gammaproteobacteria bacterium]